MTPMRLKLCVAAPRTSNGQTKQQVIHRALLEEPHLPTPPPSPGSMAADEPLFSLSLAPTGSLVCSKPSTTAAVYLLTLTSPPDNRLTTQVCQALLLALDIIEHSGPPGVVISTSGIAKFYSNGLDLNHATSTPGFWEESLYPLFRRFLT